MDYDKRRLIELVKRDAVQFGDFVLASGKRSNVYIDCRNVTLSAAGAALVGAGVCQFIAGRPIDAVGGLTLGADPIIASVLALLGAAGQPMRGFIVRKEAKQHGAGKRVEGPLRAGDRVAIVEDVATTGNSALAAIDAALAVGAHVEIVIALLDRAAGARELFESKGLQFASLLSLSDLDLPAPS